jgi:hypothetical protein
MNNAAPLPPQIQLDLPPEVRDPIQDPIYDFEKLGLGIAETLLKAAEAQVIEAQNLYEQTKALADHIRSQVAEQSQQLDDMNARLKTFGQRMLEAHQNFNGGSK